MTLRRVAVEDAADLAGFRRAARGLCAEGIGPEGVLWSLGGEGELFAEAPMQGASGTAAPGNAAPLSLPAPVHALVTDVVCHRDRERFALLYALVWRVVRGERHLTEVASDPLVHRLELMRRTIRRDRHKMHAFLRFRRIEGAEAERYVAWFEPDHHILDSVAGFFVDRFASLRWSILTPDGSLHWADGALTRGGPGRREDAPSSDALEDGWRTYYRSTFNPARVNPTMMRAEMPKKYWRNMPETTEIKALIRGAPGATGAMLAQAPEASRKRMPTAALLRASGIAPGAEARIDTLAELAGAVRACEACPLHGPATQSVPGEGAAGASIMLVGEQPGDTEDLAGRLFVGPAGAMLDRALEEAGLDRTSLYLTNAVKHFKFVPRGKRRIHQRPNTGEVNQCRWWLMHELNLVRPKLVVLLGATAGRALMGRDVAIGRERGRLDLPQGVPGWLTLHPSAILRTQGEEGQSRAFAMLVEDLRGATALADTLGPGRDMVDELGGALAAQ